MYCCACVITPPQPINTLKFPFKTNYHGNTFFFYILCLLYIGEILVVYSEFYNVKC